MIGALMNKAEKITHISTIRSKKLLKISRP